MNQLNRTIDACRDAGLPVIDEHDCTCRLRGRLVVVARAGGLEVIWPYDRRCPTHGLRDPDVPRAGCATATVTFVGCAGGVGDTKAGA